MGAHFKFEEQTKAILVVLEEHMRQGENPVKMAATQMKVENKKSRTIWEYSLKHKVSPL